MSDRSQTAVSTAGAVLPCASIRPNGSQMNDCPKNSSPSVPASASNPTRLGAATNTPLAMACARCAVRHASTCASPKVAFSAGCQPMAVG